MSPDFYRKIVFLLSNVFPKREDTNIKLARATCLALRTHEVSGKG